MNRYHLLGFCLLALASCDKDADVASQNISTAADNFEIDRRIVFYNGITGDYILQIEGRCSIGPAATPKSIYVICKTARNAYKKHFLGVSDNVTYFVEQLEAAPASTYRYRVVFKPTVIIPDIEVR